MRYFLLSEEVSSRDIKYGLHGILHGIVIAETLVEAAGKIGLSILHVFRPPATAEDFAVLENHFCLSEMREIISKPYRVTPEAFS